MHCQFILFLCVKSFVSNGNIDVTLFFREYWINVIGLFKSFISSWTTSTCTYLYKQDQRNLWSQARCKELLSLKILWSILIYFYPFWSTMVHFDLFGHSDMHITDLISEVKYLISLTKDLRSHVKDLRLQVRDLRSQVNDLRS